MPEIKTVPNQRVITVNKAVADKQHLYTVINLQALNKACNTLQSKAGVKFSYTLRRTRTSIHLLYQVLTSWNGLE